MTRHLTSTLWLTIFSLLLCAEARADSPPLIRPGDPQVSGAHLEPYRNAWKFMKRSPTGEIVDLGLWTDALQVSGESDQQRILRRQEIPRPDGTQVLINEARRADLTPISFEVQMNEQTLNRVEFAPTGLRITVAGQEEAIARPLDEPVFDWLLYGILVSGFPLDHGYAARFPALTDQLEPTVRQIQVTGRPSIPGPDGRDLACWKVTADEGLTFWLIEKAPYILRVEKEQPDGSALLWHLEEGSKPARDS